MGSFFSSDEYSRVTTLDGLNPLSLDYNPNRAVFVTDYLRRFPGKLDSATQINNVLEGEHENSKDTPLYIEHGIDLHMLRRIYRWYVSNVSDDFELFWNDYTDWLGDIKDQNGKVTFLDFIQRKHAKKQHPTAP